MVLMVGFILNTDIISFAESLDHNCEDGGSLIGATLISTQSYRQNGRRITVNTFMQKDGVIVKDTLSVGAMAICSKKGSDKATRKREISGWGSITITASFDWYTEKLFSYVKCTSMSAVSNLNNNVKKSKWETSYTKDYVRLGSAKAQVKYKFYNTKFPAQYQSGSFKITCSDSGTISDNG